MEGTYIGPNKPNMKSQPTGNAKDSAKTTEGGIFPVNTQNTHISDFLLLNLLFDGFLVSGVVHPLPYWVRFVRSNDTKLCIVYIFDEI